MKFIAPFALVFCLVGLGMGVGCSSPSVSVNDADSYSSFRYYLHNQFNDSGSRREWRRIPRNGSWVEAYPNGQETHLIEVERIVVQGTPGVRYRKVEIPGEEVFIPSRSSGNLQLKFRNNGGDWRDIGSLLNPK